jgi:hypothetical protein
LLRVIAACALLGAAIFAIWIALIAFGALCEEGCPGRSWQLVAQLVVACVALLPIAIAAHALATDRGRRWRIALAVAAAAYVAWGLYWPPPPDRGHGVRWREPHPSWAMASAKKRQIASLAYRPRGSLWDPPAAPPDQAWPSPSISKSSCMRAPRRSAQRERV